METPMAIGITLIPTVMQTGLVGDSSDMPDSEAAMTVPIVKSMLVSLGLVDTPIRYSPPIGPVMHFTVHYNQRDIAQPSTFSYAKFRPELDFQLPLIRYAVRHLRQRVRTWRRQ